MKALKKFARAAAVSGVAVAVVAAGAPNASAVAYWHRKYFDNYFRNVFTCQSRGYAVTNPENSDYIWGAQSFVCYRQPRQTKYTMDIYFYFRAGGGGGTGGWVAPAGVDPASVVTG